MLYINVEWMPIRMEHPCKEKHFCTADLFHIMNPPNISRHLERRLPMSGLKRAPACHSERSEESGHPANQILRCAQNDRLSLQMSTLWRGNLTSTVLARIMVWIYLKIMPQSREATSRVAP